MATQTTLATQKRYVEQLRIENSIQRTPVSESISMIMKFIDEHRNEDAMVVGFASKKDNPFLEKSGCTIL